MILLIYSSLMVLSFAVSVQPMTTPKLNRLEILNEATVLLSSYFILVFSDWTNTPEERYQFGYYYTIFVILSLCFNLMIIFGSMIASIYLKIKLRVVRYTNKRDALAE